MLPPYRFFCVWTIQLSKQQVFLETMMVKKNVLLANNVDESLKGLVQMFPLKNVIKCINLQKYNIMNVLVILNEIWIQNVFLHKPSTVSDFDLSVWPWPLGYKTPDLHGDLLWQVIYLMYHTSFYPKCWRSVQAFYG